MSEQGDGGGPGDRGPGPDQAARLRWLARIGVAAVGAWFLLDGLRGLWPGVGTTARVVIVGAVVLVVGLVALAVFRLARRDREG